jgi:hypothetical protein
VTSYLRGLGASFLKQTSLASAASVAAAVLLFTTAAYATTPSPNTGSLGSTADGVNADPVTFGTGAIVVPGDRAAIYNGVAGTNTVIPSFQSALNPPPANPFTVEFWANPTATDNDDAVLSNRIASGNRSGWIFFQRAEATGWNFRMYNGVGSGLGWDLTGGTSTLNAWSHVVAVWNGSAAQLYVNGTLADSSNDPAATGAYNASTTATFTIGTNEAGTSTYNGAVDETAFYPTALSPAQILSHFNAATGPSVNGYHSLIRADGALLQLSNNPVPEPSSILLAAGAAGALLIRRRRKMLGRA